MLSPKYWSFLIFFALQSVTNGRVKHIPDTPRTYVYKKYHIRSRMLFRSSRWPATRRLRGLSTNSQWRTPAGPDGSSSCYACDLCGGGGGGPCSPQCFCVVTPPRSSAYWFRFVRSPAAANGQRRSRLSPWGRTSPSFYDHVITIAVIEITRMVIRRAVVW